jgi:hypothetical protein
MYCTLCEMVIGDLGYSPAPVDTIIMSKDHHDEKHNQWQKNRRVNSWEG